MNWEGAGGEEHRTVGEYRAWCLEDHEWCYASDSEGWCDCCFYANGYEKIWVKQEEGE